jgi:hypothetical protein
MNQGDTDYQPASVIRASDDPLQPLEDTVRDPNAITDREEGVFL